MNQKQIELTDVLSSLTAKYEAAGFSIIGSGFPENETHYNQMATFDDITHKPTWASVVEEYERLVEENEKQSYAFQREREYPSMQEQLDVIFHDGLDAWKEQIQAIKDKYPKP